MLTISPPAIEVDTSEAALVAAGIDQHIGDHQTLHNISFEVTRGEVLAIAGGSGAGKTSLLEALVGLRPISAGQIRADGGPVHDGRTGLGVGFVPQDDILHLELPLRQTLEYTAAAEVIGQLKRLAAEGTTVILTTHAPGDLHRCDRVVFLARDGHVAFIGTAAEACAYFDVADLTGSMRHWPEPRTPQRSSSSSRRTLHPTRSPSPRTDRLRRPRSSPDRAPDRLERGDSGGP